MSSISASKRNAFSKNRNKRSGERERRLTGGSVVKDPLVSFSDKRGCSAPFLLRQPGAPQQFDKARVRAQALEERSGVEVKHVIGALVISLAQ